MTPDIEALSASSPVAWVTLNKTLTENQHPLEFKDHRFLIDLYADLSPDIVVKKSAQVGESVERILKSLWCAGHLKANIIYVLPCVDTETELLSKRGWLKYNEILPDDTILTLTPEMTSRWSKLEDLFIKETDSPLVEISSKQFSALTTPHHRWYVESKNRADLPNIRKWTTTEELPIGDKLIPRRVPHTNTVKPQFSNDFVELAGWVLTEGYYVKRQGSGSHRPVTSISIIQSQTHNPAHVARIRQLIRDLGIKDRSGNLGAKEYYQQQNGCVVFRIHGEVAGSIRQMFPTKELTHEFINALDPTQLQILIDTMIKADGNESAPKGNRRSYRVFIQKSKQTADAFAAACILLGYGVRVTKRKDGCYQVRLNTSRHYYANEMSYRMVEYKGVVWCPHTRDNTFLARRKGSVYWTGNTKNVVDEFVVPKVNPIILANPHIKKLVSADSKSLKQVGDRFIYFSGAFSETAAIMKSADILILDELDRMKDMAIVNMFDSRLQASKLGWRWRLSNPSNIGFGVDALYTDSDQMHWFITCHHCNHEWFIDFAPDGASHYVDQKSEQYLCGKCHKDISNSDRRNGRWVARFPGRKRRGYWISQMMAPWVSASRIIEQKNESTPDFFYNFVLGKAYTPSDMLVNRESILRACAPSNIPRTRVAMGVDQNASEQIYVLMTDQGIFDYGKVHSWEEIETIKLMYNAVVVADPAPYPTKPKQLAAKYSDFYLCYFKNQEGLSLLKWDKSNVFADRTRLLDVVATEINEARMLIRMKPHELEEYIADWQNIYRTTIEEPNGRVKSEWLKKEGRNSDFSFATCTVAGTLVTTSKGDKPIETISVGDSVLTRKGWKSVTAAGQTGIKNVVKATFSNGQELIATPDHRIHTDRGFVALQDLTDSDMISVCGSKPKSTQALTDADTSVTLEQSAGITVFTGAVQTPLRQCSTATYGHSTTARLLKAMKFITKTAIRLIMPLIIWTAYQRRSISSFTQKNGFQTQASKLEKLLRFTPLKLSPSPLGGDVNLGFTTTPLNGEGFKRLDSLYVSGARPNMRLKTEGTMPTAPQSATKNNGVKLTQIIPLDGERPVYNLSVDELPEYYANGILVHNCYARIGLNRMMTGSAEIIEPTAMNKTPKTDVISQDGRRIQTDLSQAIKDTFDRM